jgi:hypothetical protein
MEPKADWTTQAGSVLTRLETADSEEDYLTELQESLGLQ